MPDSIELRAQKFKAQVLNFRTTYDRAMLDNFYDYWTEPNKSGTKMKFELQKTWDLKRRLGTWDRNNFGTRGGVKEMQTLSPDEREKAFNEFDHSQTGYYDAWGAFIPNGTYLTVMSCPQSQWILCASPRAKKLKVLADNDMLTTEDLHEWDHICQKKIPPHRGRIQKPRWQWEREDIEYFEGFMDRYNAELKKWKGFENDLKGRVNNGTPKNN